MKEIIAGFDSHYEKIHLRSIEIVADLTPERLFLKPNTEFTFYSCGEYILRSAGKVEQTFGGITSRLWDDPFEWTLPEELSTVQKIFAYLEEVESTRKRGFEFFASDQDLGKELPTPENMQTVFQLLLETIVAAEKYQQLGLIVKEMI